MIPKNMDQYLRDHLPEGVIRTRLRREDSRCFLEFGPNDEHLLARLGITLDKLGPRLVACLWDEASPLEIGGYLVVDNLAMGMPSLGGIRMLPDVTPLAVHNLARGMTLKNAAASLPYGGGKSGIVAESDRPPGEHAATVRGFAQLIRRYSEVYVPGPDVGTNDRDMKTIEIDGSVQHAAALITEGRNNIIAVLSKDGLLAGVLTAWDLARAVGQGGVCKELQLESVMTREVISAAPSESLFDVIRKLEQHQISALPVVQEGEVLGLVNSDILLGNLGISA